MWLAMEGRMALTLKQALSITDRYAGLENNLDCVVLTPGRMAATDTFRGVSIACDVVTVALTVKADALKRIVSAVKGDVTMSVGKGRKLIVKGDGSTYKLQALPAAKAPDVLHEPSGGWTPVSPPVVAALRSLASLASTEGVLRGVRLTTEYAAAADHAAITVLWAKGIVPRPCVVRGDLFRGFEEGVEIALEGGKVWIRDADQTRWALGFVRIP